MTSDSPIRARLRNVADFPTPGVIFKDITSVLMHAPTFHTLIEVFAHRYAHAKLDAIAGIDARGFIIGAALAHALQLGFIPVRKAGKLPGDVLTQEYALEYGTATIEIQRELFPAGTRVVLVDDLIATGGTILAAHTLLTRLHAEVIEIAAVIDLPHLGGSTRLRDAEIPLFTLIAEVA